MVPAISEILHKLLDLLKNVSRSVEHVVAKLFAVIRTATKLARSRIANFRTRVLLVISHLLRQTSQVIWEILIKTGKFLLITTLVLIGIAIAPSLIYWSSKLLYWGLKLLYRKLVSLRKAYLETERIKRLEAAVQQHKRDEEKRRREENEVERNRQQRLERQRIAQLSRFQNWRNECQSVLADPRTVKGFPQPEPLQCDDTLCAAKPRCLAICPHELEKLYEESGLDSNGYRAEYYRFHPNHASLCQIPEPYRLEASKTANEINVVLQKFYERRVK